MSHQSEYLQVKESERLYIRPISINDLTSWQEFTSSNKALQYFPEEFKTNPNAANEWIEKQLKRYRDKTFGLLSLIEKSSGEYVGQCGLLMRSEFEPNMLEIGYSLLPNHWGNGYATEAAQFFRDYAFENGLMDEIISLINPLNLPSQKVALNNGMKHVENVDFYNMEHMLFRITLKEWMVLKNKGQL